MADEVKENQVAERAAENAVENGNAPRADSVSYSQVELNRMFAERAKQAENALLKKLGFDSFSAVEELVKENQAKREAELTELQKKQDSNTEPNTYVETSQIKTHHWSTR